MASVHDFIIALARTDKSPLEALDLANMSYGDRSIYRSAVYKIYAKVRAGEDATDQRNYNGQCKVRTPEFIELVRRFTKRTAFFGSRTLLTSSGAPHPLSLTASWRIWASSSRLQDGSQSC